MNRIPCLLLALLASTLLSLTAQDLPNVGNGVNIKIDFTPTRTVHQPDNRYFKAAQDYLDWLIAHRSEAGRFPEKVLLPSMEIEGYSDVNMNNKAIILAAHMSSILDDPSYYEAVRTHIKVDLRTAGSHGWPDWGEAGGGAGGGEHKQPAPRRDMFLIEPFYSEDIALGYWIQGVGDKVTGNFNRHSGCSRLSHFFINEGGARYNHWITAYQFTWFDEYLHYIDTLVNLYENHREDNGWPAADRSVGLEARMYYLKELVRALPYIPADHPLRDKIRSHIDRSIGGPIATGTIAIGTLEHKNNCINAYYDMYWHHLDRGQEDLADTYLDLLIANTDAHMDYQPAATVWPWTVGLTIRSFIGAYYATGEQQYLDKAKQLGDLALANYFDLGPLPRANIRGQINDYYRNNAFVWGDFLVLQLFELGLAVDEHYGRTHKVLWTHIR